MAQAPASYSASKKSSHDKSLASVQGELASIKNKIKTTYEGFKPNYDRYNDFKRFVFETSMSTDEQALLLDLGIPPLQFNILEAYINRWLGEFSKQQPSIMVGAQPNHKADPNVIKFVDGNLRYLLEDGDNKHTIYEVYKDLLSGGFSGFKLYTGYADQMSFDQSIMFQRVFDPTMCGWDQTARYSHKGDGEFCFEIFPKSREEYEDEIGKSTKNIKFTKTVEGFHWSYMSGNDCILLVVDFYKKKKQTVKLVRLSNGQVMTEKKYKDLRNNWDSIAQLPQIIGKPREARIDTICRYRIIENEIIEYVETDLPILPLIFVDGSSVLLKTQKNGNVHQFTRPYVYHARDAQRLKNYAGSSWANQLENVVQHKFMVKKEAIPKEEDFLSALTNYQKGSMIVTNAFFEEDPNQPIPDPIREVQQVSMPPEIAQAFITADQTIQNILGSYDAALGINDNQLSGIAIVEAASQSNATVMPFIVGILQGLQRVAQGYVDLLPQYVTTPRTMPVMDAEGKRNYVQVNQEGQEGAVMLDWESNTLDVRIEAGVNFQIQKSRALQQIEGLMKASPLFNQFINEKGLKSLLDNIEIRGIDELKIAVEDWMEELKKQKEMAMKQQQQEMMNNPAVMKAKTDQMKLQLDAQKMQSQLQIDMAKLQQAQQKVAADLEISHSQNAVQIIKSETEKFAKEVDLKMKHGDMAHKHMKESIETHMAHEDMKHRHKHVAEKSAQSKSQPAGG
jgi:hypothetical protein